jgi:acyl phosphate:glycerol-3-phosphate acyltransferase
MSIIVAKLIYIIFVGYIIGSIPFGVLVSRRKNNIDILKSGSGKMGTTNVLRTSGTKAAVMVLVGDLIKGVLPVVIAGAVFGQDLLIIHDVGLGALVAQTLAALAAMVGHNWSIFCKFKGGRGVATFFGGLIALCPPVGLISGEILVITAGLTRFMSLGSIVGTSAAYLMLIPLTIYAKFPLEYLGFALIGGIMITIMHKDNINRLFAGTERKIGQKAENLVIQSEKNKA